MASGLFSTAGRIREFLRGGSGSHDPSASPLSNDEDPSLWGDDSGQPNAATGRVPQPGRGLPQAILKEIRQLHFQTRRHVDEGVVGRYRSAFRGTGMEFEEVRDYLPGDDIRRIDWKVTARSGRPYVKSYREERELVVMLAVDLSASTRTGTRVQLRSAQLARVGAALALIALKNNDKVGLVTFSDHIESYHPPRKARSSVWRILHDVLAERKLANRPTSFETLFSFLQNVLKRKSIIFCLTDGFGAFPEPQLAALSSRHDLIMGFVEDPIDRALPNAGLVRFRDPESGEVHVIDTSSAKVRTLYAEAASTRRNHQLSLLRKYGVQHFILRTDEPFGPVLREYFDRRSRRARAPG